MNYVIPLLNSYVVSFTKASGDAPNQAIVGCTTNRHGQAVNPLVSICVHVLNVSLTSMAFTINAPFYGCRQLLGIHRLGVKDAP